MNIAIGIQWNAMKYIEIHWNTLTHKCMTDSQWSSIAKQVENIWELLRICSLAQQNANWKNQKHYKTDTQTQHISIIRKHNKYLFSCETLALRTIKYWPKYTEKHILMAEHWQYDWKKWQIIYK